MTSRRRTPETAPPHVVVVGAGIAGLAAAAAIKSARPSYDVTVLEGSPEIGGKLRLAEVGGVTVDVGAEAMLNRRPEAVTLATDVGLPIVHPATTQASIWSRGRMRPMPRSLMGVPVDHKELVDSGILSRAGTTRAALDQVLPATRLGDSDVSVGWLIEERFGKELLDRLVEPLLGGVYAGHAREISARAAIPQVVALLSHDKSLSKAAAAAVGAADSNAPVFAGVEGGLGRLPGALVKHFKLTVRTDATVRDVARSGDGGWNLILGSAADPEVMQADAVVLATPAAATARLLGAVAPDAALELARVESASMAVVTMAFRARDLPEIQGSGFLVPPVEGRDVKAATYSFAKWDWVGRAGQDVKVLRTSLGRHREEAALQATDAELVERSVHDLADAVGLSVRPVDAHVQRWGGGLPQYSVGHLERVARVRSAVAKLPGLAVAGATYDGLGIPACIASAQVAAAQVLASLDQQGE